MDTRRDKPEPCKGTDSFPYRDVLGDVSHKRKEENSKDGNALVPTEHARCISEIVGVDHTDDDRKGKDKCKDIVSRVPDISNEGLFCEYSKEKDHKPYHDPNITQCDNCVKHTILVLVGSL